MHRPVLKLIHFVVLSSLVFCCTVSDIIPLRWELSPSPSQASLTSLSLSTPLSFLWLWYKTVVSRKIADGLPLPITLGLSIVRFRASSIVWVLLIPAELGRCSAFWEKQGPWVGNNKYFSVAEAVVYRCNPVTPQFVVQTMQIIQNVTF